MAHDPHNFEEDEPLDFADTDFPFTPPPALEFYGQLAAQHGLIQEGEPIGQVLHAFITDVVQKAADIAEAHPQSAAQEIRATMLPEPLEEMVEYRQLDEQYMAAHRKRFPPTMLRHPGPTPGSSAEKEIYAQPEMFDITQVGDEWVVSFRPTAEEVYRGPGPVEIVRSPAPL